MAREVSGDGMRDAVDQARQVTTANEAAGPGRNTADPAALSGENAPDGAAPGADGRYDDDAPDAERTDDDDAGNAALGAADAAEADAPSELIDFAEPVELDEPGAPLRAPRRWPRWLIVAVFVVLAAAIVGGAVAIVGSVTHGFKKPVKVTYKRSAVFSLKTGDCFDPQGQSYTLVSCDSPHTAEVFATFSLPGTTWPGNTAVSADAISGCATRLTGYLNPQLSISLANAYVYPDATAWQAGTRTVICEVRATSGDLTGSVRAAAG
jgi:hypothetical protein